MSGLSEEQKKKIDENKRKALALRAAKNNIQASKPNQIPQQAPLKPTYNITSNIQNQKSHSVNKPTSSFVPSQNKFLPSQNNSNFFKPASIKPAGTSLNRTGSIINQQKPFVALQQKQLNFNRTSTQSSPRNKTNCNGYSVYGNQRSDEKSKLVESVSAPSPSKGSHAAVKGKCVLVSSRRFMVDIGFNSGVIEVFKTIPSRQYDTQTKKWSFDLKDYTTLVQKVGGLGSFINLEPLPRSVLSAFSYCLKDQPARTIKDVDLKDVDSVLSTALYQFQKDAINFAVHHGGRVLIADDMGLGKTLQSLCVAAYYRKEWPLLIVVPSSVRFSWREQILKWLPSVDPQEINVVVTGKDSCTTGLIIIVSYDLMVKMKKSLQERNFKVIIMDESHSLKNSKTARTQAALPMMKKASRVILLSGTPALSRPSELFTQINAVDHTIFSKFHDFGVRYCDGKQNPWGWDFSGSSNLAELQLVLEEKIMIRRMKKDVLEELPDKCRQMVILDPNSVKINKQMKASHTMVDKMKGNERRGALLEYFNDTGGAKIKAIREYVLDLLDSDRKFLMFAHHQEVLNATEEAVAKKYEYIRIDGKTTSEQRNILVNKFQKQDDVKIAILSITAANAGINLTAATLVVFAELFWNPGILMQAEDRAHRIGQQDSVTVHYLVAPGTADDYIWPLVQQKLEVLGRAGLSKDDFSEAKTERLKDPRQKEILDFFEESFMEDDLLAEMGEEFACNNNAEEKMCKNAPRNDSTSQQQQKQTGLFQYFKPPGCSSTDLPEEGEQYNNIQYSTNQNAQFKNNAANQNKQFKKCSTNQNEPLKSCTANKNDRFKSCAANQNRDLLDDINNEWDQEVGSSDFMSKDSKDQALSSDILSKDFMDEVVDDWDLETDDDPDAPWPPKPKKTKY